MSQAPNLGSLQARLSESDPRLYNVNRDVAHNFKDVMTHVLERVQERKWLELEEVLEDMRVTDAEVNAAFSALCTFIASAQEDMEHRVSYQEGLTKAGWFKCTPMSQVAILAVLGTVIMGYHWTGVREVTLRGQGPALTLAELAQESGRVARFMTMPRWRRKLSLLGVRLRNVWRALTGAT